jgi:hypothetical protein
MDISFPSAKFAYLWRSAQIGFKLPSFKTHNSDFELTGSKHRRERERARHGDSGHARPGEGHGSTVLEGNNLGYLSKL